MGTCDVADKLTEVGTKAQSAEETATEEIEAEWGENIKAAAAEEETATAEATPPRSRRLNCDGVEYSTVASRKMRKAEATAAEEAAAAAQAGFAFAAYTATKFSGIIARLARLTHAAAPELGLADASLIADVLREELATRGLDNLSEQGGAASAEGVMPCSTRVMMMALS